MPQFSKTLAKELNEIKQINRMEKTTLQAFEEVINDAFDSDVCSMHELRKKQAFNCNEIHSEEVEKHLALFLDWVDKGTYFFQDKDVTIKQVVSQYMNSYFNQQSKDK